MSAGPIIVSTHVCFLQIWQNCRTYNEAPHKVLDMCTEAEAIFTAEWEKWGAERIQAAVNAPSKKRKTRDSHSLRATDKALLDIGTSQPDKTRNKKKLKIMIRSNAGTHKA